MHASLARERYHRARADADVGQRAAVKTYEELGGFAPPLAPPRHNSQDAQDVEDEHGRYSLDRIRDLVSFTPECFPRLPPELSRLFRSFAEERRGRGPSGRTRGSPGALLLGFLRAGDRAAARVVGVTASHAVWA